MVKDLGVYSTTGTVSLEFATLSQTGSVVAPVSPLEAADIRIYKSGSAIPKGTTAGVTMISPYGGVGGYHQVTIDLTDNTDAGFWESGKEYTIILAPDELIDGATVVQLLALFKIGSLTVVADDECGEGGIPVETLVKAATGVATFKSDMQEVSAHPIADLIALDKHLQDRKAACASAANSDPFQGLRFGLAVPPGTRGRQ